MLRDTSFILLNFILLNFILLNFILLNFILLGVPHSYILNYGLY
jgi:hypothetical protein